MAVDKKVADGLLRLILLKGPLGNCVFTGDYDRKAPGRNTQRILQVLNRHRVVDVVPNARMF
ncbi:hypothetical protein GBA52_028983 [Prunus armeniaca]|nr:hypothetical protein GBA52_028983 [Prunus armeniaca]